MQSATKSGSAVSELYLDLLKKCLTRTISSETYSASEPWFGLTRLWFAPVQAFLWARGWSWSSTASPTARRAMKGGTGRLMLKR